jgi:hypothetical protein
MPAYFGERLNPLVLGRAKDGSKEKLKFGLI